MPEWNNYWSALNGGDLSPEFLMTQYIETINQYRRNASLKSARRDRVARLKREIEALADYFRDSLKRDVRLHWLSEGASKNCTWYEDVVLEVFYYFESKLFVVSYSLIDPRYVARFFTDRHIQFRDLGGNWLFGYTALFSVNTLIPELLAKIEEEESHSIENV